MPTYALSDLLIATNLTAWDRLIRALSNRDLPLLSQLLANRDLISVPAGSAVIIDEDLATLTRVHVLDGPAAGVRGLVTSRSLAPTSVAA
ncbi:MAG: hypothetical protein AAB263_09515 [Planctomycetota bacterium]